jgi:UDP-glucose 4-epimerase
MGNILRKKRSTINHFPNDDEGMIRDYCFVGDIVRANLCALDKGNGDFFNIGTGKGTKTFVLYKLIFNVYKDLGEGVSEDLAICEKQIARSGDLTRSCLVVEKARKGLDWIPEVDLEDGIRRTWQWRLGQPI